MAVKLIQKWDVKRLRLMVSGRDGI